MARAEVIVLTNCTNRKREAIPSSLRASSLPPGTYRKTSEVWLSRVGAARQRFPANQLYCGRAVTETLSVGETLGAEVAFVSAGLGIVEQFQQIPAYSLTASLGHPDSVSEHITESYDPRLWWAALAHAQRAGHALARYIDSCDASLVLVAMPSTYLAMVATDLEELGTKVLGTIRLMGPRREEEVPECLRSVWLRYDSRLDNPETGFNGTASDFPHRALRHFATNILQHNRYGSGPSHAEDVEKTLARFEAYLRPRGRTASDQQVICEIARLWKKHGGRRTLILRELRSVRRVACEQSRFRLLADEVEANLNAAS